MNYVDTDESFNRSEPPGVRTSYNVHSPHSMDIHKYFHKSGVYIVYTCDVHPLAQKGLSLECGKSKR